MSEIDDIFASSKKAPPPPDPVPSSSKSSKKKKKKKSHEDVVSPSLDVASSAKKRPAPETVVDTSDLLIGSSKRHKPNEEEKKYKTPKTDKKKSDVDPDFKDSRGTGNRKCLVVFHIQRRLLNLFQVVQQKRVGLYTKRTNSVSVMKVAVSQCASLLFLHLLLLPIRHSAMSIRL